MSTPHVNRRGTRRATVVWHNLASVTRLSDGSYTSRCTCGQTWTGPDAATEPDTDTRQEAAWTPLADHVYELTIKPGLRDLA